MKKSYIVLVVDDDHVNRAILEEYLDDAGYTAIFAENGQEALDTIHKTDVDLVLLDRMMPVMDGMELMEKINENEKLSEEIPVIMQTAAAGITEVIEGSQTGVFYYLTKPFTEKMLLSAVKAALESVGKC